MLCYLFDFWKTDVFSKRKCINAELNAFLNSDNICLRYPAVLEQSVYGDGFCGRSIVRKSYRISRSLAPTLPTCAYLAAAPQEVHGGLYFNASRRYRKVRSKCTCRWPQCVYKSLENQAQRVRAYKRKNTSIIARRGIPTRWKIVCIRINVECVSAWTAKNMRKTYCAVTFFIIRAHICEILACR